MTKSTDFPGTRSVLAFHMTCLDFPHAQTNTYCAEYANTTLHVESPASSSTGCLLLKVSKSYSNRQRKKIREIAVQDLNASRSLNHHYFYTPRDVKTPCVIMTGQRWRFLFCNEDTLCPSRCSSEMIHRLPNGSRPS